MRARRGETASASAFFLWKSSASSTRGLRAARARRENLVRSAAELKEQLSDAKGQLDEANAELVKAQGLEGREKGAERADFPAPVAMMDGMMGLRAIGA